MQNGQRQTTLDIWSAAFQLAHGHTPHLEMQSGRVIFAFEDGEKFRILNEKFNQDECIGCLTYAAAARRLRGELLSLRERSGGRR